MFLKPISFHHMFILFGCLECERKEKKFDKNVKKPSYRGKGPSLMWVAMGGLRLGKKQRGGGGDFMGFGEQRGRYERLRLGKMNNNKRKKEY
jgi:hypothetical protein